MILARESHLCILTFSESHNNPPCWFNLMLDIPLQLFTFFPLKMFFLNFLLFYFAYSWHLCPTAISNPLISLLCSDFLSRSSVRGYTGRQRLLGGRRLMLEWWDLQSTSADSASVCGGQWQREAGPRCQEPVCQRSVCPAGQPLTWMPV